MSYYRLLSHPSLPALSRQWSLARRWERRQERRREAEQAAAQARADGDEADDARHEGEGGEGRGRGGEQISGRCCWCQWSCRRCGWCRAEQQRRELGRCECGETRRHADMQTCRHTDTQTCRHADMGGTGGWFLPAGRLGFISSADKSVVLRRVAQGIRQTVRRCDLLRAVCAVCCGNSVCAVLPCAGAVQPHHRCATAVQPHHRCATTVQPHHMCDGVAQHHLVAVLGVFLSLLAGHTHRTCVGARAYMFYPSLSFPSLPLTSPPAPLPSRACSSCWMVLCLSSPPLLLAHTPSGW